MEKVILILIFCVVHLNGVCQRICSDLQITVDLSTETDTIIHYQVDDTLAYYHPTKIFFTLCNFSSDTIYIQKISGNNFSFTKAMGKITLLPNSIYSDIASAWGLNGGLFNRQVSFWYTRKNINRYKSIMIKGFKKYENK